MNIILDILCTSVISFYALAFTIGCGILFATAVALLFKLTCEIIDCLQTKLIISRAKTLESEPARTYSMNIVDVINQLIPMYAYNKHGSAMFIDPDIRALKSDKIDYEGLSKYIDMILPSSLVRDNLTKVRMYLYEDMKSTPSTWRKFIKDSEMLSIFDNFVEAKFDFRSVGILTEEDFKSRGDNEEQY